MTLLFIVLLIPLIGAVAGGFVGVLLGAIAASLKSDLDMKSTMKRWGIALAILGAIAGVVYLGWAWMGIMDANAV